MRIEDKMQQIQHTSTENSGQVGQEEKLKHNSLFVRNCFVWILTLVLFKC